MTVLYLKYIDGTIPLLVHGLLCVLAYAFWSLLLLVCFPVFLVCKIYKTLETTLISYQKLGTLFSPHDIPFLHETETNRNFIVGMVELKGEPNVGKLRKWVMSRFLNKNRKLHKTYERLSQRVTKRYFSYVWQEENNFSIRQHIPIYKGPRPRTKKDMELICSKLASEPFPQDISPWMFKVIPKQEKDGYFIYVKVHHVIGDGFAMIGLLSQLVDQKPQFMQLPKKPTGFMSNHVQRLVSGILTGPLALLTVALSINFQNHFKAIKAVDRKTVSWSAPISLAVVKKIKTETGSTVNDVLMSCLAGAIRTYLEKKSVTPVDQPIAMTFNSRSLSDKMKKQIPLGNNSGGLLLSLPISETDPLKRLQVTRYRINLLKRLSHAHVFSFVYFQIVSGLPDYLSRLSTFSVKRHTSMIVSNVPGPTAPLYILGAQVKSIVFTPPLHADIGLAASMFSYNNTLQLTIMSDENIISEPEEVTQAFVNEVSLLEQKIFT